MTDAQAASVRSAVMKLCMKSGVNADDGEAIAQEVVCRIVGYDRRIKNLKAWACACALNLIRHRYREWKRSQKRIPVPSRLQVGPPEEELMKYELKVAVASMFRTLTVKQRQAVQNWLRKRTGEKFHSPGKERALLSRAFGALRERFPEAVLLIT